VTPGSLPPDRLEENLPDAKPVYSPGDALTEANRCLYCHDAPCVTACPTGIDIPTFIRKIGTGNVKGSAKAILSANLLGYSCARVCPVEVLCVGACVYNEWERTPIAIGRLQRFAVESQLAAGAASALFTKAPANGKKVACVGAGPASLACAGYLALEGFAVTVYEKRDMAGGLNTSGVAPYKMDVEGGLAEVAFIRSLGVDIRTGVEIGRDVALDALVRDHDAVFIGVGLGADSTLGIPGEDGPGVTGAVAWIERLKLEPGFAVLGVMRAVVIGGGNTAIDAARELAQLEIPEVSMLYRRSEADMSGYAHEMHHARAEGVRLIERAQPARFERDASGALTGVTLADGRTVPCELAVVAIGQARLRDLAAQLPGVAVDAKGVIKADARTGATGHAKVFAGGDAIGGELVVTAAQDGKRAARGIAQALGIELRADSPMRAGHE
jgi:glutamate synthase (NADPH/NADH) small chain